MDDDILSQGEDREPSPWPHRLLLIAPLVALVIGAAVVLSLPRHQHAPAAHPAGASASATPAPAGPAAVSAPPGPNGIAGPTLAWNPGLRLPDAAARPVWFSPASGRAEQIGGLPAAASGYQFTRVAGGWAVQAPTAAPAGCASCAGPVTPVWFLADGAQSVTRIGAASVVAPAATAGAVWLTSYGPGADTATAAGTAREADAAGALTAPVRLPSGYAIDQGTDRGLLLTPVGQQPGAAVSRLWDPATGQTSRVFDHVLAASPGEIAWTTPCAPTCRVQVLDLATGRHTVAALPAGNAVTDGAFSPDGSLLALQVSLPNAGDGGDLALQLEVASVTSGQLTVVPGSFVSSDALVGFGWPGGGDSLVAEFIFTTKTQLASWPPGAARPAVTVVPPGRDQAALILG